MQEQDRILAPVAEMTETDGPTLKEKYRPSNLEALREYELGIKFLHRGCIVRVGCKEIAFESVENAMKAINDYVANPWEEQQKWLKILN